MPNRRSDVAVAILVRGGDILLGYNPKWRRYTLPMTKKQAGERWGDAAQRAVEEWFPELVMPPGRLRKIGEIDALGWVSERTRIPADYRYSIWTTVVRRGVEPEHLEGNAFRWCTLEHIRRAHAKAVSGTARGILYWIAAYAAGQGMDLIPWLKHGGWGIARIY